MKNAHFVKNKANNEIRFAIEDKYLRVALNAKLRECDYFADTSFNKDIVSLNQEAFEQMIKSLVPNFDRDVVLEKLNAVTLTDEIKKGEIKTIIGEFAKIVISEASKQGLTQLIGLLMA